MRGEKSDKTCRKRLCFSRCQPQTERQPRAERWFWARCFTFQSAFPFGSTWELNDCLGLVGVGGGMGGRGGGDE